jgi:predicted transposase YbfD/YdcC
LKKRKKLKETELFRLVEHLREISDPRVQGRSKHKLIDIIVVSVCAILCGAVSSVDIEDFGVEKEDWFRRFLELPNGIPSHDTFLRVLSLIDPIEVERAFADWAREVKSLKRVSIDGKSIEGTGNFKLRPLHLVSAYAHEEGLSLGQCESAGTGSGEAQAGLECLKLLDLKGVLVMADAGLAIHRIVSEIRQKGGDYLVPIKRNQRYYLERIIDKLKGARPDRATVKEKSHGRLEERECLVLPAAGLDEKFYAQWPGIRTIIQVNRVRQTRDGRMNLQKKDKDGRHYYETNRAKVRVKEETVYYLSSRKLKAREALAETRRHWGIENNFHWVLDTAFGEDDWKVREKRLARNLSVLRRIGFNLVKKAKLEGSVRRRMKRAGWNEKILETLVFGAPF